MPNSEKSARARLAACLDAPDGCTSEQAIEMANTAVEFKSADLNARIDSVVDRVGELTALMDDEPPGAALMRDLYETANSIYSVAATFGRVRLGEAAHSLCDLIEALNERENWDYAAVRVHASAISALKRARPETQAASKELVAGLRRIVKKVSA